MRYQKWITLLVLLSIAATSDSCSSGITVTNKTNFGIKVAVFPPKGGMRVVSPDPGGSSMVESNDAGMFTAVAIPSSTWVEWARDQRKTISGLLANPQGMSPETIRILTIKLKEINTQIQQLEQLAKDSGGSCTGKLVPTEGTEPIEIFGLEFPLTVIKGAFVDVTLGSGGKLDATCR